MGRNHPQLHLGESAARHRKPDHRPSRRGTDVGRPLGGRRADGAVRRDCQGPRRSHLPVARHKSARLVPHFMVEHGHASDGMGRGMPAGRARRIYQRETQSPPVVRPARGHSRRARRGSPRLSPRPRLQRHVGQLGQCHSAPARTGSLSGSGDDRNPDSATRCGGQQANQEPDRPAHCHALRQPAHRNDPQRRRGRWLRHLHRRRAHPQTSRRVRAVEQALLVATRRLGHHNRLGRALRRGPSTSQMAGHYLHEHLGIATRKTRHRSSRRLLPRLGNPGPRR